MTTRFVQDGLAVAQKLGVDPGMEVPGYRQDTGEGVFFERQLESVEARFYEKKLRELKYRTLLPVSNRDGPGALTITYYFYTKFGAAKIIANPTDDLPRVDVAATRHTADVRVVGVSWGFGTQEIRNAQFSGVPLEAQRAAAARRAINEEFNRIAWNGDSTYGLVGVLDNPNVPDVQVAQAATGTNSRIWGVDKTATEIADDIGDRVIQIRQDTQEVHSPTHLLLPIDKKAFIESQPWNTANPSNITIADWIRRQWDLEIVALPELTGSGTGSSDQGFLYEMDDEILELRIPMEMQILPPQARNLQFHVPAEAEIAGVVIRYPLAMIKFYGI